MKAAISAAYQNKAALAHQWRRRAGEWRGGMAAKQQHSDALGGGRHQWRRDDNINGRQTC